MAFTKFLISNFKTIEENKDETHQDIGIGYESE
jgi:hypothetical protein